jgi:ATP-dependent RNA helicase DeaD
MTRRAASSPRVRRATTIVAPRANAPGSRDHTPRPSTYGDDGVSNAKPYARGEEPKRDYKPREFKPRDRDNPQPRATSSPARRCGDDAPRDFKPRAPRDNDAPRPYSPQDSDSPKRAYKPRAESVPDDPPREFKPFAPKAFARQRAAGGQDDLGTQALCR